MRSANQVLELEVVVHGRPVTEYARLGNMFVEGRIGSEFVLRVRNNSDRRSVVVVSVDGLSVMNGRTASRLDSGYVLDSNENLEIPGWRLNDQAVANFFFSALPGAYASQMDKPDNIGVIGAVMYHEKYQPLIFLGSTGGATRGFGSMVRARGVGTGFGREIEHTVQRIRFEREDTPAGEITLRYDTAEGLRSRGIVVVSPHLRPVDPVIVADPFPADHGCQPPAGWPRK